MSSDYIINVFLQVVFRREEAEGGEGLEEGGVAGAEEVAVSWH